jgi:hypothetical protein
MAQAYFVFQGGPAPGLQTGPFETVDSGVVSPEGENILKYSAWAEAAALMFRNRYRRAGGER